MSKTKLTKTKTKEQSTESGTFTTVFFYCILIIALPIFIFFSSKYFVFDTFFDLSVTNSHIWSAVSAVVALHVALGLYIYRAYFDGEQKASSKQD